MLETDRSQTTIWRTRFAYWVTKTTHTLTHTLMTYNTYYSSTATMVTRTRFNVRFICTLLILLKAICMLSREEQQGENICGRSIYKNVSCHDIMRSESRHRVVMYTKVLGK